MKRETIEKLLVTLVLVLWYLLMPQAGYKPYTEDANSNLVGIDHYAYMLSHANIWHLCGNLLVVWLVRRLRLYSSLVIAILASFLPAVGCVWDGFVFDSITMGFSGVLFAAIGSNWGYGIYRTTNDARRNMYYRDFFFKVLPFALLGVLVPHINWCLHTYCLLSGFVYGRCRR